MKTLQTLIAMARAKCHTDRELAERIGVHPIALTEMKRGKRAISPETVAALCDVLELPGSEAREWLAISVIENPKNKSKLALLKRALFACWALGVVVSPSMISMNDASATEVGASTIASTESQSGLGQLTQLRNALNTHCRAWVSRVRRGLHAARAARDRLRRSRVYHLSPDPV